MFIETLVSALGQWPVVEMSGQWASSGLLADHLRDAMPALRPQDYGEVLAHLAQDHTLTRFVRENLEQTRLT